MGNYFEKDLSNAILECDGMYVKDLENCQGFSKIYPFTTENISGYIDKFDLVGKSLLTVGSSGDQVINAALFNCFDQTVVDICPFTKYYFYLKKAALMYFSLDEYIDFFCYCDFPKFCYNNKNVFSKDKFNRIKELLGFLDYESFLFWDEVFSLYKPEVVRCELFSSDEERARVLKGINLYMRDDFCFEKAKVLIRDVNPEFICGDIINVKLNRNYDNIFLSNLGLYFGIDKLKLLADKMSLHLNDKMLLCYLYKTEKNTKYKKDWSDIYNLEKVNLALGNYISSFDSFCGVRGILFEDESYERDSVLIYEKSKVLLKNND